MLARFNWQLIVLAIVACLFTACSGDDLPVTLTVQADNIAAQAAMLSEQTDQLATAEVWSSTARVTLTAWPQNAIATQDALLSEHATTQAQVIFQAGTAAVGTSQAVEATIRADGISAAEAIAATDLAIQVATIESGRNALATAIAEHDILVATATQAAGDFATGVAQWQSAGTAIADEFANTVGLFAQTSTALAEEQATQQARYQSLVTTSTAAALQNDAAVADLRATMTVQVDHDQVALATSQMMGTQAAGLADRSATDIADLEVQLATATAQVVDVAGQLASAETQIAADSAVWATAANEYADLLADSTRAAANAQVRQAEWRDLVTLQAGVYATRIEELYSALSTQDALLTAAYEPTATGMPTATASASPTPTLTNTASQIVSPSVTPTLTPTPTATPTVTQSSTPMPTVTFTVTPSLTATPSITPTPFLCWVLAANREGVNIREEPAIKSGNVILAVPMHTVMSVTGQTMDNNDRVWYAVLLDQDPDGQLEGWVASNVVEELTDCPSN